MLKLITGAVVFLSTSMGIMSFVKLRSHVISSLLSLEFASLSIYLLMLMSTSNCGSELFLSLVYLTIAACEAALGLSVLVFMMKCNGNDMLKINNLTQC